MQKKLKNLKILSGFASDLARISGDPPGDPDNFRRDNIVGSHCSLASGGRGSDQGQNEKKIFNENYYFSGANRVTKYLNGNFDVMIKINEINKKK